ncbi:MAG: ABC transporter permease [Gammaproteobacteria bacterium]
MFATLSNVLHKETLDVIRDRRSIGISLSFAIFGPVFLALMLNNMAESANDPNDLRVVVAGGEHAPGLITHLEERGVMFSNADNESAARALLDEQQRVTLSIPKDYAQKFTNSDTVDLAITGDFKSDAAQQDARELQMKIERYNLDVSQGRLIAAGVAPHRVRAVRAGTYDLSRAGGKSALISDSLIYVFLIAGFVAGAFMTADAVAGERERHSLEPLLAQPVSPMTLIVGKWLACGAISVLVSTLTVVVGGILLARTPLAELGLRLSIGPKSMLLATLALAPLALFAVALQMLLAARAKTYREAGISGQFTMFLPVVVAGAIMIGNVDYSGLASHLPLTGQTLLLQDIFLDGRASPLTLVTVSVSSLLAAWGMLVVASRWIADEARL